MAVLIFVLLIEGFLLIQIFLVFPFTNLFSSILPNVLVNLTNQDRQENNIGSLANNPLLEKAARLKADDMAAKGYFDHTSPDGKSPWYWLDQVGYSFEEAGENLAVNFSDSSEIDKAWMNSLPHRENIVNKNFTEIGIAASRGLYKGKETVFVVQFFGRPAAVNVKAAQAEAPKNKSALSPAPRAASETKSVAGAKSNITEAPLPLPAQETFIVKNDSQAPAQTNTSPSASENKISAKQSFWLLKILTMPKTAVAFIYFLIVMMVGLSLILKIFIKIRIQYPRLIFNGILVLFVIISIMYLNSLILENGVVF